MHSDIDVVSENVVLRVPRMVHVSVGEKTCLDCGETVSMCENFCSRCRGADPNSYAKSGRNLVSTLSYLKPDEANLTGTPDAIKRSARRRAKLEAQVFLEWRNA